MPAPPARQAEAEIVEAARVARDWARGAPLILGGDFNLRPALSRHVFDRLASDFGLRGANRRTRHRPPARRRARHRRAACAVAARASRGARPHGRSRHRAAPGSALRSRAGRSAVRNCRNRAIRRPVVVPDAAAAVRCDICGTCQQQGRGNHGHHRPQEEHPPPEGLAIRRAAGQEHRSLPRRPRAQRHAPARADPGDRRRHGQARPDDPRRRQRARLQARLPGAQAVRGAGQGARGAARAGA